MEQLVDVGSCVGTSGVEVIGDFVGFPPGSLICPFGRLRDDSTFG